MASVMLVVHLPGNTEYHLTAGTFVLAGLLLLPERRQRVGLLGEPVAKRGTWVTQSQLTDSQISVVLPLAGLAWPVLSCPGRLARRRISKYSLHVQVKS
jgi:hypothetical protein